MPLPRPGYYTDEELAEEWKEWGATVDLVQRYIETGQLQGKPYHEDQDHDEQCFIYKVSLKEVIKFEVEHGITPKKRGHSQESLVGQELATAAVTNICEVSSETPEDHAARRKKEGYTNKQIAAELANSFFEPTGKPLQYGKISDILEPGRYNEDQISAKRQNGRRLAKLEDATRKDNQIRDEIVTPCRA